MGMDSVIDLTLGALLAFSSLLIIPLIISHFYQLAIAKEALLSVGRMALQLIIMIAIFVTLTLSVVITLELALHRCLDRNGQVKINTLDTK